MHHTFDPVHIDEIKRWLGTGSINFFGRPFAGKDTHGRILSELLDGPLIGGGDILRNSVIPERSKQALKKGLLIPTDEYVKIVLPYLKQSDFRNRPLILSSVGRWKGEESSVIQATEKSGHPMKAIFYLDISEESIRKRWQHVQGSDSHDRGDRTDDKADILEIRLKEFQEKTLPVVDYYRKTPLFFSVDADLPAPEVTAQILTKLLEISKTK